MAAPILESRAADSSSGQTPRLSIPPTANPSTRVEEGVVAEEGILEAAETVGALVEAECLVLNAGVEIVERKVGDSLYSTNKCFVKILKTNFLHLFKISSIVISVVQAHFLLHTLAYLDVVL